MYELPFSMYTDEQLKAQMYHFLYVLATSGRLDGHHEQLILKYLDIVTKEQSELINKTNI